MIDPPRQFDSQRIRFEDFEADLRTEELLKSGTPVRLPHQSFCVLAMLLGRAGQLVTREELRARLWPAGAPIEYDQRLNAAVNRLREALLDSADAPRFVETLPKRGYRFIAAVEAVLLPSPPEMSDAIGVSSRVNLAVGSEVARSSAGAGASMLQAASAGSAAGLAQAASPGSAAGLVQGTSPGAVALPIPSQPADLVGIGARVRMLWAGRRGLFVVVAGLTAAAVIAVLLALTHRSPARFSFGRQVVPLASLPGKEIAPTFSPDGSQIAFAWNEGADAGHQFDLYVKSLGSERLLRLTHQPSTWVSSAWSPDGSTIAFVRQTDEGAGIFIIPALGGSERSIVSNGVAVGYIQISWSPDGHLLAYSGYGPTGTPQVNLVSVDTASTRPLAPAPQCLSAAEPAFSPDGKQLALVCISSSAVYTVDVVELPDGPVRRLASMLGEPQGLAWTADGSRLIVSNDPGDGGELWQFTLNGEREQLPFGEDGSAPTVAARGGRMAYVRGRKTVDIWRADLTAAQPEQSAAKLIYSTRTQVLPRYSRDGSRIAFQSNRSGSVEIWMTDAQGDNLDRLTWFNGPLTSAPSWCSDGQRIAFDSRLSGISGIYIEDLHDRVPRKLVTSASNLSRPAWSEDCRWLFALDGNNTLYRIPSSGGPAEHFTDRPSSYCVVVADRLIFNVLESDGVVLWSKPVDGGPQAPLEGVPKIRYEDSWAATSTGIYYSDSRSKPISVNFFELASRSTRRLFTLKQAPIPGAGPGLSISPDGRWLLYGQSGDESSEIMLAPAHRR